MKNFEIIDSLFNKEESKKYDLSIQLTPDGFSFSIIDHVEKKLLVLKSKGIESYEDIINDDYYCQYMYDFIISDELLKLDYNETRLIFYTKYYTLVPNSVFDKKEVKNIYLKNFGQNTDKQIIDNNINAIDATVIFSIPESIYRVLNRQFSSISYYHQSTCIINYSSQKSTSDKPSIYVFQDVNEFDISLYLKGKLLAYNSFEFTTSEDIVYHLFNLIDQHSSVESIEDIVLSGRVRIFKEFIPNLKKFFKKLDFIKPEDNLQISSFFDNIQLQDYNLLFLPK